MARLAALVLYLVSLNVSAGDLHAAVVKIDDSEFRSKTNYYFATLINDSDDMARGCGIRSGFEHGLILSFWTTDKTHNQITGQLNEAADIWPRSAQTYVFRLVVNSRPKNTTGTIFPDFRCFDRTSPIRIEGTNSVDLSAFDFSNVPAVPGSE